MPKRGENIYKRKDGRWEGRIKIEFNGKVKYKYFYGKTYKIVKEKIALFKITDSPTSECSYKTIDSLFNEWFTAIQFSVKPSTLYNYKTKVKKHIIPAFGKLYYNELEVSMINNFISDKVSTGLSIGYVCDIIAVLKSMAKYMYKVYGYKNIITNVTIPRGKTKDLSLLSDEQQKILFKTLTTCINETKLCILLSFYTGIRIGEVCGLTWSDVDFINNTININKTVQRIHDTDSSLTRLIIDIPKSKSSKRIIPLPTFITEILKKYKGDADTYILSGNNNIMEPRTLQRRFKSILKKSGLPDINYHSLRHMFATNCIKLGFDIKTLSEILGHSSIEITLKRYVHASLERKIECMNLLSPKL
ncbi:MAG: site-specific integrase [Oscillospiraceae bacterium]|nr:site-specific integrase [Oscillospiraceae bacterium]